MIDWSGARRPTSLRHDAAEAIMIGLWGVLHLGWLVPSPESCNGIDMEVKIAKGFPLTDAAIGVY